MMLMMSPPTPSIRATAAPPFSLLPDRLTDRQTDGGRLKHPAPFLLLIHNGPDSSSSCLPLNTVSIDASSAAAEAEADSPS
ncbi:hypothetical protein PBY51_021479 [Eleginops maclovinus]|uniref:Uncharacterized protein n=1 Tax=Eleginops maclovinus TaxID=56733 RepID=A0AAN7XFS7_ELEMC|nr:hypothetical protein PBY51_021479 [Eleginops maclovinus]